MRTEQRIALFAVVGVALVVGLLLTPEWSWAAAAGNPWEKPLQDIANSVIGPVAMAAFLIGLCIWAFMWWVGYTAIGAAVGLVIGGAIIANADSIASWIGLKG